MEILGKSEKSIINSNVPIYCGYVKIFSLKFIFILESFIHTMKYDH